MEARGYDPSAKRTKYRVSKWQVKDTISSLVVLVILGGCIALLITKVDLVAMVVSLLVG